MKNRGYTLIELVVVFSIIAVLSTMAIAGFALYNRNQTLEVATSDIVTFLNTAKSRTTSQIKPSTCLGQPLNGYEFRVISPTSYYLNVSCGSSTYTVDSKTLPTNITFQTPNGTAVLFKILNNGVTGAGPLIISGYGTTKYISVCYDGRISTGNPTVTIDSSTVVAGANVKVSWCGIQSPASTDWVGLYLQSAGNYTDWVYVNCTKSTTVGIASGNCNFTIPSNASLGTYLFKLTNVGGTVLATSPTFTIK